MYRSRISRNSPSGRFRGKRVVVLKRLDSGLLLVSGPYKVNGVPLKRVNAAYVIPTSTKVPVTGVDMSALNDAYFAKSKVKSSKKDENAFFNEEQPQLKSQSPVLTC